MKKIDYFLNKDFRSLTESEKLELFQILEPPIKFAIKKALSKFYKVPLEFQDMQSYAWMAFDDLLKKYQTKNIKKKFVSSVIDAVTWKCTDACVKYINNKHKVLNNSVYKTQENNLKEDNVKEMSYSEFTMGWEDLIEKYFQTTEEPLAREIFYMYANEVSKTEICDTLDISRNKFTRILRKTISDLQELAKPLL